MPVMLPFLFCVLVTLTSSAGNFNTMTEYSKILSVRIMLSMSQFSATLKLNFPFNILGEKVKDTSPICLIRPAC